MEKELTQIEKLEKRVPYDKSKGDYKDYLEYLEQLLEDAKNIGLRRLYPFEDISEKTFEKEYYNWQLRACEEINTFAEFNGLKSYSENGLSFSRDIDSGISLSLLHELVPFAGIPKRKVVDTDV